MKKIFFFLIIAVLLPANLFAAEKNKAVSTTATFTSIAREIAGDKIEIHSIASPKRDIHFYQPTPKDVLKVKKADVLIHGGLDLEVWREPLLHAAGNPKFLGGGEFSIDASKGISLLEIPSVVSRAEGDIHLYGNPHYWLDPENMEIIASNIGEGLVRAFPEHADEFLKNTDAFKRKLNGKTAEWKRRLKPYEGMAVVTYHRSWVYFAKRFGFEIVGEVEPKPGIPPTAKHIAEIVKIMKEKKAKLMFKETYFENRTPSKIAKETQGVVVTLAQTVGEVKEAQDYISMMEYNVRAVETAFTAGEEEKSA
jgi:ABC-type Zn uptake system ZnuABC Zn-binding protein ZnuA